MAAFSTVARLLLSRLYSATVVKQVRLLVAGRLYQDHAGLCSRWCLIHCRFRFMTCLRLSTTSVLSCLRPSTTRVRKVCMGSFMTVTS
jgi:hypothetical protein